MAILQAKKLKAALEKAKKVGLVEEAVTIAGCQLVLRSLMPDEYEQINEEVKELEEVAYLHAFQIGHLSRSIVEIDGVDLRDADFIEVEEEGSKPIKLEKHAWLRDILKTWSREAILSAWRKVLEVLALSEAKAKEGITFSIAEESSEEKFRRLLSEMKEATSDLPDEMVLKILDDEGFMLKTSQAELEAATEKLSEVVQTEEAPVEAPPPEAPPVPVTQEAAEDLMRNRTPMNQGAVEVPIPKPVVTVQASKRAEVPEAIRQAAVPVQSLSRAAQIAALEGDAALEPVELRRQPVAASGEVTLDRPPTAGINPRFSAPRRV